MGRQEKCYITKMSEDTLKKYGLSIEDAKTINELLNVAISNKLYTDTKDFHHDLKHIEKVLAYTIMIVNKINNPLINKNLLLTAVLYHDIGKTIGVSNSKHGKIGAEEFRQKMTGKMDSKDIEIVCKLIYQHAVDEDIIDFSETNFTEEEKKLIQIMSDILKDADALDRNRLNYPAPIGTCDVNKLRTNEAKEIFDLSDSFYEDYYLTAIVEKKEKNPNSVKLAGSDHNSDAYKILNDWIKESKEGKKNMFHASLDPSIDVLVPKESTQKGEYIYAGIDPISCVKMASFRFSTLFPSKEINGVKTITEIFPGSIENTLKSKYITIYRLPNNKFHEYKEPNTSAPSGEWVSEEPVEPIEQLTFPALDFFDYLRENNLLNVQYVKSNDINEKNNNFIDREDLLQKLIEDFIPSFEMYIWEIKKMKTDPKAREKRWKLLQEIVRYYLKDEEQYNKVINILLSIKEEIDSIIAEKIEEYIKKHGKEPNYDDEKSYLSSMIERYIEKYYLLKEKNGKKNIDSINHEYISNLIMNQESKRL